MAKRSFKLKLISAYGLNKLIRVGKMDVYAVAYISGGSVNQDQKQRTYVDKGGDSNPTWNCSMKFTIDEYRSRQTLVVKIMMEATLGDKIVGEVQVPIKELLEGYSPGSKSLRSVSYQVTKPSGKLKGELNFSYKFGASKLEKPVKADDAKYSKMHEPVTRYRSDSLYPPVDVASDFYPPPPVGGANYPSVGYPQPQAGYTYQQQSCYGGYPPPPPPGYDGYPPKQSGYGGYPPQSSGYDGYPLKQPSYGGYPQPPPVNDGYPPQQSGYGGYPLPSSGYDGYPLKQSSYGGYPQPPVNDGYPPQQSGYGGYPPPSSGYDGYPSKQSGYGGYPQSPQVNDGYPPQQSGYGGNYPQPPLVYNGYPPQQSGYGDRPQPPVHDEYPPQRPGYGGYRSPPRGNGGYPSKQSGNRGYSPFQPKNKFGMGLGAWLLAVVGGLVLGEIMSNIATCGGCNDGC